MYFLVWNAKKIQQKIAKLVVSIFGGVNICFIGHLVLSFVYSEMFYMIFFVVEKNANYTTSNTTKYNVDTDNGKHKISI